MNLRRKEGGDLLAACLGDLGIFLDDREHMVIKIREAAAADLEVDLAAAGLGEREERI